MPQINQMPLLSPVPSGGILPVFSKGKTYQTTIADINNSIVEYNSTSEIPFAKIVFAANVEEQNAAPINTIIIRTDLL